MPLLFLFSFFFFPLLSPLPADNNSCFSSEIFVLSCSAAALCGPWFEAVKFLGSSPSPRVQNSLGSSGVARAREPGSWGHCLGVSQEPTPARLVYRAQGVASKTSHSLSPLSSLMFINAVKKPCMGVLLCRLGLTHVCHLICVREFVPVPSGLALSSLAPRLWRGGRSSCLAVCAPCAHREMGLQLQGNEVLLV